MGTWAVLLGCRAPADLRDLWPEAEPAWGPLVPGWALGLSSDFEGRANLPETLARAPGHALAATLVDSDFAWVVGAADGEQRWELFLNAESAAGYNAPLPPIPAGEDPGLHTALAAWAVEAGLAPPQAGALRKVLATQHILADDALHELLRVLGILPPASQSPAGGAVSP